MLPVIHVTAAVTGLVGVIKSSEAAGTAEVPTARLCMSKRANGVAEVGMLHLGSLVYYQASH